MGRVNFIECSREADSGLLHRVCTAHMQDVRPRLRIAIYAVSCAGPMERLNALIQTRPQSGAARNVRRDYDRLLAQMASFEAAKLEEWCADIGDVSEQTLKQPLLRCERATTDTAQPRVRMTRESTPMMSLAKSFVRFFYENKTGCQG